MAITPDPATTEWVPVWDTKGSSSGGGGGPHAVTHNTGGSDAITNLSATVITSGTLPDIRLSGNVVLNNKNNFFSRRQLFKGGAGDSPSPYYGIEVQGVDALAGDHAAIVLNAANQPLDKKKFRIYNYQQRLIIGSLSDAEDVLGAEAITITRDGNIQILPTASASRLQLGGNTNAYPAIRFTGASLEVVLADNSNWAQVTALNYYAIGTGNNFGDLTVRGAVQINGGTNIAGALVVTGNISSQGYVFPGRFDVAGTQGSWYIAGHGSYGLYINTGLYTEGSIWTNAVESRNHIRAAAGLYDYGRGTPIGVQTGQSPSLSFICNLAYMLQYIIIGKTMTMFWNLQNCSAGTNQASVKIGIPGGAVAANGYFTGFHFYNDAGTNVLAMCATDPNGTTINLFKSPISDFFASTTFGTRGSISFQIQ